jgi:hypothetical protein
MLYGSCNGMRDNPLLALIMLVVIVLAALIISHIDLFLP